MPLAQQLFSMIQYIHPTGYSNGFQHAVSSVSHTASAEYKISELGFLALSNPSVPPCEEKGEPHCNDDSLVHAGKCMPMLHAQTVYPMPLPNDGSWSEEIGQLRNYC